MPRRNATPFKSLRSWLLLTAVCVCAPALMPYAWAVDNTADTATEKAALNITVRAGTHDDFDRLAFDWPHAVSYKLNRESTRVTLEFSAPAHVNARSFNAAHLARIQNFVVDDTKASDDKEALRVSFAVGPHAIIKDFLSGHTVVIDVSGAVPSQAQAAAAVAAPTLTSPSKALSEPINSSLPKPQEKIIVPAAAISTVLPVLSTETKTAAAKPPVPTLNKVEAPQILATPQSAEMVSLNAIGSAPELLFAFDPHEIIGAAIFMRGDNGYIVFDRKVTIDLPHLTVGTSRVTLQAMDLGRVNGYRFSLPSGLRIQATRSGTQWQVFGTRQQSEIAVTTGLIMQPDFALGARVILPSVKAPEPVHFNDPVIGDNLFLVPLQETEAFSAPLHMADFDVLVSAQGLIIRPLHDKVYVRAVSDGIEMTAQGGLRLSPATDTGASQQSEKKAKAAVSGKSIYDFAAWRGKPNESFTQAKQHLMQTIVDVPEAERNRARLEFARFYFARGMGAETLSLLNFLAGQIPDLATHAEFLALRGGASILAAHPRDGLRDLSDPSLAYQPEIELWQAVASAQLRDWKTAEEKFNLTESILTGYPEPFYSHFSLLAVEAALAMEKDREAAEWLDRLETGEHIADIKPALHYLRGVLHGKSGRATVAQILWRGVADTNDYLYKTRAELALVDLDVATHSLTPIQAADRLEGLRFAWRGDDLEIDILQRLGQFYIDAKNYRSGLTVLAQAVHLYPDSPMTPAIRTLMANTFRDVFVGDRASNMSPIEALTLFNDFRELMPTGEDGKVVVRNLAERLVAIDLLDQAAALLEEQVKNTTGDERAHTGTRLAAIRLLNHKPDNALAALDMSQSDGMPPALQSDRLLLRARALSEQQKNDEALALLKDNTTQPGKILRADITMRAGRWREAAAALQDLIGAPPQAGEALTPEQAQWLVSDAIALSLANDMVGLDKLAIDFGASMAGTTMNDTFRVLTRPEKANQMKDIAAAQSRIAEVDMFHGFLDSYRDAPAPAKKDDAKAK